jgi:hypothetical protein
VDRDKNKNSGRGNEVKVTTSRIKQERIKKIKKNEKVQTLYISLYAK